MTRIVRCSITMDLHDNEHFNYEADKITDAEAIVLAERSFIDMINEIDNDGDLHDWVETKIVSEIS